MTTTNELSTTSSLTEVTKMEVDYSSTCDQKIPEAENLAKTKLQDAIDMLIALEKQTRIVRIFFNLFPFVRNVHVLMYFQF